LPARDADDAASKGAMPVSAGAQLLQITPRQYEVLVLLARGYPIKTVSRMLNISVATAKTHACTLYQRLHVKNKGEAVYAALQRGATLEWHEPNGRDVDAGQMYGRKVG
jgi:DNA-binding NarL/FixJ family response regulator